MSWSRATRLSALSGRKGARAAHGCGASYTEGISSPQHFQAERRDVDFVTFREDTRLSNMSHILVAGIFSSGEGRSRCGGYC